MNKIEAGQFISFFYNAPSKLGIPESKNKQVFILHPNWRNQVHAIDLQKLTPAEQQVLRSVMDAKNKQLVDAGQWPIQGVPNYPLIRDILKRFDPTALIKNPIAFYQMFVKPFIANKDCYRKYSVNYIANVKVIQESSVSGNITNPAPLFKKI